MVKRGAKMSCAEFKRLYTDRNVTLQSIADRLGVSVQAVVSRGNTRGLPRRTRGRPSKAIEMQKDPVFKEMLEYGVCRGDIGAYYGVHRSKVNEAARRLGVLGDHNKWNKKNIASFVLAKQARKNDRLYKAMWGDGIEVHHILKKFEDSRALSEGS